jgi:hypothetical protein
LKGGARFEFVKAVDCSMEVLPMIAPKQVAGGMEFLVTVGLSALAGLLAFLLVSLVVNVLGLIG